ncbi:ribosomal-protein-alanine N-acetyltransferase [Alteromonas lipolytica]|uniref:[Ribosomal protein bS18]-alanine N-acetyltransferase n=1 Tax=Alteromonas lipolytica TaxID=1856405 RepID=A0A1E8FKY0_9ALTE|nr:ribosomal-protein-alanine N-acetyltransferase [Alteromonas lipolytica]
MCQAGPASAGDAYPIHCEAQYAPWSESTFLDCTTPPYECWLMKHEGQVVGYAILLIVLDEVTLMDIAISQSQRGLGAGKALLNFVIERCRQLNARCCFLEVRESNVVAQQLYLRSGFTQLERRKGYYPTAEGREDALMMWLQLDAAAQ